MKFNELDFLLHQYVVVSLLHSNIEVLLYKYSLTSMSQIFNHNNVISSIVIAFTYTHTLTVCVLCMEFNTLTILLCRPVSPVSAESASQR